MSHDIGKTLLFMGFRNRHVDFIYEREWDTWREQLGNDTFGYWTGFSRDDRENKTYVQDVVEKHSREVMEILDKSYSSRVYICGSAEMARGVTARLAKIREAHTKESEEQALNWIKSLRKSGRLLEDVWS
jgi:NADPH-ferrihemoprotein reductase